MTKLVHCVHYVFYCAYQHSLRVDREGEAAAAYKAVIIWSLCLYLNLFAAIIALGWLVHIQLIPAGVPKVWLAVFAVAFFYWPYRYFFHRNRYRTIAAEFDTWDADRRWYANRRVIFYILSSFLALGAAAYCGKNHPNPLHLPW